jgi:hypothetical protein
VHEIKHDALPLYGAPSRPRRGASPQGAKGAGREK